MKSVKLLVSMVADKLISSFKEKQNAEQIFPIAKWQMFSITKISLKNKFTFIVDRNIFIN